jgi:hypothetical protein
MEKRQILNRMVARINYTHVFSKIVLYGSAYRGGLLINKCSLTPRRRTSTELGTEQPTFKLERLWQTCFNCRSDQHVTAVAKLQTSVIFIAILIAHLYLYWFLTVDANTLTTVYQPCLKRKSNKLANEIHWKRGEITNKTSDCIQAYHLRV